MKKQLKITTRKSVKFSDKKIVEGQFCHYTNMRQGFKNKNFEKWRTKNSIKIEEIK
jgi:hypothetical protein